MEIIKYKRYRIEELRNVFFQSSVFFSRSSNFRAGCPGKADLVKAFLEEEEAEGQTQYSVIVRAELQKHMDYVGECLAGLGYALVDGQSVWTKSVRVLFKPGADALGVLKDTLKALDDVSNELPMCLYETCETKRLRNYISFMSAWKSRMRFSAIVDYRGAKRDKLPSGIKKAAQSSYLRRGFGAMADYYCLAELPDKHWCAWFEGDEAIPVFPNEKLAVHFLEDRHIVYYAS